MTGSIDKQKAIKLVADYLYNLMSPRCIGLTPDHCWKEAEDILAKAQSAEPERKKGKWIHGREIAREYLGYEIIHVDYEDYHCSECGYTVKNIRWNVDGELLDRYCSFCGADMRGE